MDRTPRDAVAIGSLESCDMSSCPEQSLRLALAQFEAVPGDIKANVARTDAIVRRAAEAGAHLVAFPELSLTGYELTFLAQNDDGWLSPDDTRLAPLRQTCRDLRLTLVVGAPVRDADKTPRIAAFILFPDGSLRCWQKQHLHHTEVGVFRGGQAGPPFDVAGWRVALGICFDAACPSHAAEAAGRGADLYLVSALYMRGEERRVDLHLGARAMDHRMFSALANYAGTTGGFESLGGSGVWRPTGEVARRVEGTAPELVVSDLDPGELRRYRVAAAS
jgi:predicted amidohydrolase